MRRLPDAMGHWGKRPIIGYTRKGAPVYAISGGSPGAAVGAGVATAGTPPYASGDYPAGAPGVIPFVRASKRVREKFWTVVAASGASAVDQGPQNITPGGFLRGIFLVVTAAGGALGTGTLSGDYPFNVFKSITLEDVNGNPIIGPINGYDLYLFNKYFPGSYANGDPTEMPNYVGTINCYFSIVVPCEVRSDGLGCLGNTDARAQYRLKFTLEQTSVLISAGAPTAATYTITAFVDTYGQVEPTNLQGVPNVQVPPGLGTTQFARKETPPVVAGAQNVKHSIVGNLIRGWMYVTRDSSGVRQDHLTDPIRIRLDTRYIIPGESPDARWQTQNRDLPTPAFGNLRETGVYVYSFARDLAGAGGAGDEGNWLETNESTFLQLECTFAAGATVCQILVNDVAPHGEFEYPSEIA